MSMHAQDLAYRAARRAFLADLEAAGFSQLHPGTGGPDADPVPGYWVRRCHTCGHDINHEPHISNCWLEAFLATYQERAPRWCKMGDVCPYSQKVHEKANWPQEHMDWQLNRSGWDETPWAIRPEPER